MKKRYLILAAAAAIMILSACQSGKQAAGKVLKFNPPSGTGYDYELVWDMDQEMMGQHNTIRISSLYSMDVTAEQAGVRTITSTYRHFAMYMKVMGVEIDIDTDKPVPAPAPGEADSFSPDMLKSIFAGIVGKSFHVKVDEAGTVLEVSGFREILTSMLDSITQAAAVRQQAEASLRDQFSDETIKDQMALLFNIFPNKAVKEGDTWEKKYNTGGKMPATYTTTFTAREIDGDHVTLDTRTVITSSGETAGMGMELKGTQTGQLLVDSKTGLMVSASYDQDIETSVQGMKIGMKGKGRIKGKAR